MLCLFGYIAFVRLQVELVSSATCLVRGVVLKAYAACVCRAVVCTQTEGVQVYHTKLRESVAVVVVRVAVAVVLIHGYAV